MFGRHHLVAGLHEVVSKALVTECVKARGQGALVTE